jgi:hypothetical protein
MIHSLESNDLLHDQLKYGQAIRINNQIYWRNLDDLKAYRQASNLSDNSPHERYNSNLKTKKWSIIIWIRNKCHMIMLKLFSRW